MIAKALREMATFLHRPEVEKVALITGANRGLGLETARQLIDREWRVWVSARSRKKAVAACHLLGDRALPIVIDVANETSVETAFEDIGMSGHGLSVVINNAGIDYDTDQRSPNVDFSRIHRTFETNFFGAWRVAKASAPLLAEQDHSVIVNVSSGAGAISSMQSGTPGYATSKAALNALTRQLAADLQPQRTLVNAVCPGWVATDMGGGGRPISDGAAGIVWAATLGPDGPSSGFFRDTEPIDW